MKALSEHQRLIQTRQKARRMALGILFHTEFPNDTKSLFDQDWAKLFNEAIDATTEREILRLVEGVMQSREAIDHDLKKSLENWKLERVMLVDKTILRLATWEMKYAPDPLPAPIVIDEYVELAKIYGTAESGGFVNGVLDRVARDIPWQKDELEKAEKN